MPFPDQRLGPLSSQKSAKHIDLSGVQRQRRVLRSRVRGSRDFRGGGWTFPKLFLGEKAVTGHGGIAAYPVQIAEINGDLRPRGFAYGGLVLSDRSLDERIGPGVLPLFPERVPGSQIPAKLGLRLMKKALQPTRI